MNLNQLIWKQKVTVRELEATEETVIPYTANGPRMLILSERVIQSEEIKRPVFH